MKDSISVGTVTSQARGEGGRLDAARSPHRLRPRSRHDKKEESMKRALAIGWVLLALLGCAPRGISTREGYLQVPGGRVWYRIVGSGHRTPLLLLHGGPGAPSYYLEPLAKLAADRPVVFYDQLGCGRSDQPNDSTLWTIDHFVAELAEVRKQLGLGRVHLLGTSW